MVKSGIFLFLGSDETQKRQRLGLLEKDCYPPDLKELNYTSFSADDKHLTFDLIEESLDCFPTPGAKKRLILIRRAHRLDGQARERLNSKILTGGSSNYLVLDIEDFQGARLWIKDLKAGGAVVVQFKEKVLPNNFDLGRAIASGKTEDALRILMDLVALRQSPEMIIGAVFWQWEQLGAQKRLRGENYRTGLRKVHEADKRMKSSSSAYARQHLILETLVIELSSLA